MLIKNSSLCGDVFSGLMEKDRRTESQWPENYRYCKGKSTGIPVGLTGPGQRQGILGYHELQEFRLAMDCMSSITEGKAEGR